MFVVAGVTGHTGAAVADTLLEKKQQVRVIVRTADKGATWRARGAEVAVASLDDTQAMARAFEGAKGAYLLIPPNYAAASYLEDRKKVADALAKAVKASGLGHMVFLSSVGAHLPEGTGPIRIVRYGEQQLGAAAKSITILRPPYFFENWQPVLGVAKAEGVLPSFIAPGKKIPMISTRDIGRIAAEQLIAGGRGRTVLELSGPDGYSPNDVAAALGKILKHPVKVQQAPLTAVVLTFKSFGFSDDAARLFEEMYRGFEQGTIDFEKTGATHVRGQVALAEALAQLV
ncbi:MAG: NmrA family NAD(P)-binding protein [Nitrospiraceae bacterium]